MNKKIGVYVHIPFCKSKCYYCDFCSKEIDCNKESSCISSYIDAVCVEILNNAEILSERGISTIYFGGGTPSYIDTKYIEKIMALLSNFVLDKNIECTIELNPADVNVEKLREYTCMGFNRFSLGVQSVNDISLKKIGRRHTKKEVDEAIACFEQAGINNVSIDVITGLPEETEDMFNETLNYITALKDKNVIKHVSIYSLEVHENTKLGFLISEKMLSLPSEDDERNMKHMADSILEKNGYMMYEISNYAMEGYESKHNLNYWKCGEYLGFGVAAASYINSTRYSNISSISDYVSSIKIGKSIINEREELDKLGLMKEFVILNLRLNEGVSFNRFKELFNTDTFSLFDIEISKNISDELLEYFNDETEKSNCIDGTVKGMRLTDKGRDLANIVWQTFI